MTKNKRCLIITSSKIIDILKKCRKQSIVDREVSKHLNAITYDSTPSVYTTKLIDDIIDDLSKENEYLSELMYKYLLEDDKETRETIEKEVVLEWERSGKSKQT